MGGAPQRTRNKGVARAGGKMGRVIKPPKVTNKPKKEAMTPKAQATERTQKVKATLSGEDPNTKSTLGG